jgi:argonaute-like protein implicated in RNA metabolism and viral defense
VPVQSPPKLLFAFREQDRQAARFLAMSLRGSTNSGLNFPGFKGLFKTDIQIDGNPFVFPDLTEGTMKNFLDRAMGEKANNPNVLPVIVLPLGDDNGYHAQKSLFSHSEIPTQVCTLKILQDQDSLKWAVGNLALQMFCKAGGMPWKVRPTAQRSLIIGISQSHKLRVEDGRTQVQRYFAFSVMTDNSGLFQKIQVLGEGDDEQTYLTNLKNTLREELRTNVSGFANVVIHTSFKLRFREIDAIQSVVNEAATNEQGPGCKFAVIKVNHKSRFFGINESVNSLVPYEGSKVSLGNHEYLIWFEGIFPDKTTVHKAFPGPAHIQFLRVEGQTMTWAEERDLIQDLVNLSGANWRGFNAKAAPVSVFYCHLVADLVHDFYSRGLPLPAVHDIRPWFL